MIAYYRMSGDILNQSESKRFPDFFLVGAPRCGTTALSRYLTRNPQICFSRPKEPHYFTKTRYIPDTEELNRDYLDRCFAHATPSHRALGEGSVSYLYAPEAIEHILHFNPKARFMVLVRNPLRMLPSYHLRMQFLLQEDKADFAEAWELESARKRGEQLPKRCLEPRVLFYSEVASFGAQIEQLYKIAGREQTHVIVFDDFVSNTLGEYKRILEFLNVDFDGQTEFERRYESQMYRYRWLQQILFVPATSDGKIVDTLQQRARKYNPDGTKKMSFVKRLTRLNKVPKSPTPLTPQMVDIVSETLRPDIRHLSQLLDRDLSHWIDE
ncbi:MAG: sulfotransferase [Xanthomonadales bacterium]|nr:sulfotransferase [Xanthomonadales bacterium]